jgi:uncharacterized protein YbbK (DUF523 family)
MVTSFQVMNKISQKHGLKKSQEKNILMSACLLGNPVRYDGTDLLIAHPLLAKWKKQGRLVSICPEVAGGMSTPRAPAEITSQKGGTVTDCNQNDVSEAFLLGAKAALKLAIDNNCAVAIMTESSPSCGSSTIYDGSFTGTKVEGKGITTTLLEQNGIRVFNQHQLNEVDAFLLGK